MKSKPKADMFVWYWFTVLLVILFVYGCMTARKAERAIDKFPEIAERKLLNNLPRIIIRDTFTKLEVDSSGFIESIIAANDVSARAGIYIDSLQDRIDQLSVGAKELCADFLLINDALVQENKTLNRLMANVKPIVKTVTLERRYEDTLRSILLNNQLARTTDTLSKVRSELKTYKDKAKGNFTLYFPKWLLWLIIIGTVVYFGVKNKTLIGKFIKSVK